jgi:pimeloyl-ACP methyl ester carboxylesterase
MTPHVFIFINGIKNDPGASDGWTDRAVTSTHIRYPLLPVKGEKFEYAATAIFRRLKQDERARAFAKMISFYVDAGFRITLVGHSNGCDIIARVLDLVRGVDSVHLFAPAADAKDFERALAFGKVGKIHIYGSTRDAALKAAKLSRTLFGWAGLGYGSLGLQAAEFAKANPGKVFDHSDDAQGHSTWFDRGQRFEQTMNLLFEHELLFQ